MKRAKSAPWKERDFEKWFMANPALPNGEKLAVIGQESALRRVADIVALDANAGLVIMEIKNETALRSTVGQALEYLSQYEEATVDSLSDDLRRLDERPIEEVFAQVFGKALTTIHASRRVIIVAPRFDHHSCHGISFLNRVFASAGITFELLQAKRQGKGFALQFIEPPSLRHSSQMVGKFGLTPGHRLVFVLEGGSPQILWVLGAKRDGTLKLSKHEAVTKRALRPGARLLLPDEADSLVDFRLKGSTWRCKNRPQETAKVIGVVDAPSGKEVFFAVSKSGQWGFRRRVLQKFMKYWKKEEMPTPSWREIVTAVRARGTESSG